MEHLTLVREAEGFLTARSVIVGERGGTPYGVRYEIAMDPGYCVRRLEVGTTDGRGLSLHGDGNGRWWTVGGEHLPLFDGCLDIDLAGTPFTNTLPIRRIDWQREPGAVEIGVVYIPFDSFTPRRDAQRYRCLNPGRLYRYEAVDRSFTADLSVDEDGLVLDYPTLFLRVRDQA